MGKKMIFNTENHRDRYGKTRKALLTIIVPAYMWKPI